MSAIALHEDNYVSTYADFTLIEKWQVKTYQHIPGGDYISNS